MVVFKELQILTSYTLETTYYAAVNSGSGATIKQNSQKKKGFVDEANQIKSTDLHKIGEDLAMSLLSIVNSKIMKKKFI
jgi:hypothetical protein